jgi:1-deoxyxylulose-5-phosphate synthase
MQYKKLGRTGLKVSQICLGTMNYGDPVSETEAINIIKSGLAAGVNFLDTADRYVGGKSEEIVGKALKGERHSVIIATKMGGPTGSGPNGRGLSREHIMYAIEGSLKRLQTDYIDLYYAHMPDYDTPMEETLRAMDDLVHQGKVRYIGCANHYAWQISHALRLSAVHNLVRFDCVQPQYNLLTRDAELELLPLCDNEGLGVCTYSPLAAEMLTNKHEFGKPPAEGRFTDHQYGQMSLNMYWSEINFKAVDRFRRIAREHGCSLIQFALAWVLNNKTITSVLSGTTEVGQLNENLAATEVELSPAELKACDEVWQEYFRPPRQPYAWGPGQMGTTGAGRK